jgi:SAM-dependent methyltransferase
MPHPSSPKEPKHKSLAKATMGEFEMSTDAVQIQREHYDLIAERYENHYGDIYSRQYRRRFINEPLFAGIDLQGRKVLEAMCGSGHTTEYLLSKGARVTGLDISSEEMTSFKRNWPDANAVCASMLNSGLPDGYFDCVGVIGGLHHLHPNLNEAIHEIHRTLKRGGYLCFAEPHKQALADIVREYWYKHDSLFADNESSIDLRQLKHDFAGHFSFKSESYRGNVAYLLVLNSMVFRVPLSLKRIYSPPLMAFESVIERLQGRLMSCFVVSQWQKL